jgi:hypothetical protein
MRSTTPLTAVLLLAGCQEYGMNGLLPEQESIPILRIEPTELYFDDTHHEERSQKWLLISNDGGAALEIDGLRVQGSAIFSVEDEDLHLMIEPGESYELPVFFVPGDDLDLPAFFEPGGDIEHATLEIKSNDRYGPWHQVPLQGAGLYPLLEVDPNPYDYGEVLFDCSWEKTFTLSNAGRAALTIDEVAASGWDFSITDLPDLPMELAPGETAELVLLFAPTVTQDVENELEFVTNEPRGSGTFTQYAAGSNENHIVDSWRQPDGAWEMSDILFYVDQSGSMGDDQENLANNFSLFTTTMNEVLNDYQIIVVTDDSGCHNLEVITPSTVNPGEVFHQAVSGGGGSLTEAGLSVARNALQQTGSGACNEGFGREGAKVMPVLISDEPEQSDAIWSQLTDEIVVLEPSASISAIAGPVPYGCRTASAGTGYWEATWATGGLFLSICDRDWGTNLQNLAVLATAEPHKTFVLSSQPVVKESIVVTVDFVENWDWSFDEDENAVRFSADLAPQPLSWVEIEYDLTCAD